MSAVTAWIERNIIADDPNPTYSRLDRLDGLAPVVSGGCYHQNHRRCDTTACQCGCHK